MNKKDIIKSYKEVKLELAVIEEVEIPKQSAKDLEIEYDAVLETILRLAENEKIATVLGTVEIKDVDAHEGRNPRTKEIIQIEAGKKIKVSSNAFTKKRFK
jgi:nucleoid DNA-binding protein